MHLRYLAAALLALGCIQPVVAEPTAEDIDQLRRELSALKQQYEHHVQTLEARLAELEQAPPAAAASAAPSAGAASAAASATRAFNPALSVILNGRYGAYSRDPDDRELAGFQAGGEAGLADEGFTLNETELAASANIDDWFYGQLNAVVHDDELELEEAFIQTLSLPAGLRVKGGRFLSEIGYQNSVHAHAWDFADAPLAYEAFLGRHYYDDGVQVAWVAPLPLWLELGAELLRGDSFPAAGAQRDGAGARSLFAHLGGAIGEHHEWQLGLSHLWAEAHERSGGHGHGHEEEEGHDEHLALFDGDSDLASVDLVWRWYPTGDPRRQVKLQAEYFEREERGQLLIEEEDELEQTRYRGDHSGWYAQVLWQPNLRWRTGVRYDRLQADNDADDLEVLEEAGLLAGHDPQRWSWMLEFNRSEFSRVRLQYNRERIGGVLDHQWVLQYVHSLGAHGAHRF